VRNKNSRSLGCRIDSVGRCEGSPYVIKAHDTSGHSSRIILRRSSLDSCPVFTPCLPSPTLSLPHHPHLLTVSTYKTCHTTSQFPLISPIPSLSNTHTPHVSLSPSSSQDNTMNQYSQRSETDPLLPSDHPSKKPFYRPRLLWRVPYTQFRFTPRFLTFLPLLGSFQLR
jgi:hypothetical protein